ncbi:F5/8 type C domain-containing protein [Zhouia amylolytica]|uniref:F5/8 type C domain-containing protein n=1 Tax=Zhouia amylolytica TaxID=376730 RepID=A0A1I6VM89_9FLAO|nr:M60 family metallopeptidase [Zhouia amylolytica]SFT14731.1 F5/8 type C domain-containing protein [Zhouia amylolytica]
MKTLNFMKRASKFGLLILLVATSACTEKEFTEISESMLTNTNSTLIAGFTPVDSIQTVIEKPSSDVENDRLGQGAGASDFVPTGFYLEPNATLTIETSELTSGTTNSKIQLGIGTYSRYSNKWNPQWIALDWGVNTIQADAYGGVIWLRYTNRQAENETPTGQATVRFIDGFKRFPYYKHGITTQSEWHAMLNAYPNAPDVTLEGEHVYIVVSRNKAIEFKDRDQDVLLDLTTQIMDIEDDISGLDGSATIHKRNVHKILMTETDDPGTYMSATWYRTAYNDQGAVNYIINPDQLYQQGWGPWHELGHMHQQQAWKWDGLGEVTVNIYSLAVERAMGVTPSRLVSEGHWSEVKAFMSQEQRKRDFNGKGVSVWVKLAMFHQLWLAFGDEFYQNLHKQTREDAPQVISTEEKMNYFMITACTVSGYNLTRFFQDWGFQFKNAKATYNAIAELNLPEPPQDLTQLSDDPNYNTAFTIESYSSQETSAENGAALNIIDGNLDTYWHSEWSSGNSKYPHYIIIDTESSTTINGFSLTQRQNGSRHVKDIELLISDDNKSWNSLGSFQLNQTTTPQSIDLNQSVQSRYIKIQMNSSYDGTENAALAEFEII